MIYPIITIVVVLHVVLGLALLCVPKVQLRSLAARAPRVFMPADVVPDSPEEAKVFLFWRLFGAGALCVAAGIALASMTLGG